MANDVVNISALIVTKLQGISGLNGVYNYEIDKPTNGKYPFATVAIRSGVGEFGDTIRNIRRHTFVINIYQERTQAAFGNEKAERLIREMIDEILTAFDNDTRLGGAVKMVTPLSYNADYVDREIGDTRIVQFEGECMTVVDSVT